MWQQEGKPYNDRIVARNSQKGVYRLRGSGCSQALWDGAEGEPVALNRSRVSVRTVILHRIGIIFSFMKYLPFFLFIAGSLHAQHSPFFYTHKKYDKTTEALSLWEQSGFGHGGEAIGDLDQDGVSEWLLISHQADSVRCFVIFPDSSGTILKVVSQEPPALPGADLTPDGRIGQGMAAAGDLTGDGSVEVWVGEPFGREGPLRYGALWLWSIAPDGKITARSRWGGRSDLFLTRLTLEGRMGADITWLTDEIIAVAAPNPPKRGTGCVYLLRHSAGQNLEILAELGRNEVLPWSDEIRPNDQFATGLCSPGDLDGNGMPELLIGASDDDGAGQGKGALHLLFLSKAGAVIRHQKLTPGDPGLRLPLDPGDRFGYRMATLRSLQDSTAWIAVTAARDDDGGKDAGALYMLTLHQAGHIDAWHKISDLTYNFEGTLGYRHEFGAFVTGIGDHNRDGVNDLLVGGPGDANDNGASWLLMPSDWPERLRDTARWLGSFSLTPSDSAFMFRNASTAEDSARVLQSYNLDEYARNHLVLVLDVSASMNKPDRLPLLKEALQDLLPYMRPDDQLSVITYSGKPEVQLEAVPLEARGLITETLQGLRSAGDTKPGKALKLALQLAQSHYIPSGNNRIIFGTDGGFEQDEIQRNLEEIAGSHVTMSVFYFGKLPASRIADMTEIASRTGGNAAHITRQTVRGALLHESKVVGRRE